jgi:hypothetical protein
VVVEAIAVEAVAEAVVLTLPEVRAVVHIRVVVLVAVRVLREAVLLLRVAGNF